MTPPPKPKVEFVKENMDTGLVFAFFLRLHLKETYPTVNISLQIPHDSLMLVIELNRALDKLSDKTIDRLTALVALREQMTGSDTLETIALARALTRIKQFVVPVSE